MLYQFAEHGRVCGNGAEGTQVGERREFLEICDDRYQRRSMIQIWPMPVAHWHEQIGDPTIAD